MEEPACNSGVEPDKKRKRNPEYWERKKLHATETTTAIKRGLARLSKDKNITSLLEMYVVVASRIACEASLLAILHVTRLMGKNKAVSPLAQTFFSRCLASIANLDIGRTIRAKDNDLFESVQAYSLLLPESYEPIDCTPSLAVVLENIAQQTHENFTASISVNFFSRQYPTPCAEKKWLQSLVNEVRSKVSLPLKPFEKPHTYLPCLYFVLKEIEKYNQDLNLHDQSDPRAIKAFALLPQKKLQPISIKVSNTVLKELNKELNICRPQLVDMPVRDLWGHYFDLTKSTKSKTKNFSHCIVTDDLSASVNLVRWRKASLQAREESSAGVLFAQADRVVAADPGRNTVFTVVVHDARAMHDLAKPEAGYTHRQNVTKRWTEKAAGIAKFNSEVSTVKTATLSAIEPRARHVLYYLPAVLDFYCARRFRWLKWKIYIRTQKAYFKIVADLSGGSAKTLIVWGDARFPAAGLGSPAVSTCTLRRKLGFRMQIVGQNEFRTSKLCCACHGEMIEYRNPRTNQVPWTRRVCPSNACPRRVWDRNVPAAINILALFLCRVRSEPPPPAFRRTVPTPIETQVV